MEEFDELKAWLRSLFERGSKYAVEDAAYGLLLKGVAREPILVDVLVLEGPDAAKQYKDQARWNWSNRVHTLPLLLHTADEGLAEPTFQDLRDIGNVYLPRTSESIPIVRSQLEHAVRSSVGPMLSYVEWGEFPIIKTYELTSTWPYRAGHRLSDIQLRMLEGMSMAKRIPNSDIRFAAEAELDKSYAASIRPSGSQKE